MSRRTPRRERPEWMRKVDRDMRLYMIYGKTIEHQINIIDGYRLDGPRITPVYELREGSSGGDSTCQTERTVIELVTANERIKQAQRYRSTIDGIVYAASEGDADKVTFIKRYWLTSSSPLVRVRTTLVIDALEWLAYKNWREGGSPGTPNRTFFRWKKELYRKLGELMGYLELDRP